MLNSVTMQDARTMLESVMHARLVIASMHAIVLLVSQPVLSLAELVESSKFLACQPENYIKFSIPLKFWL